MVSAIRNLEAKLQKESSFEGEWQSAITQKQGREPLLKCHLDVDAKVPSNFRLGAEGPLQARWPALQQGLETNLRGATARLAVIPSKIWKVQEKVGCTWRIVQIDIEAQEEHVTDYFAAQRR